MVQIRFGAPGILYISLDREWMDCSLGEIHPINFVLYISFSFTDYVVKKQKKSH